MLENMTIILYIEDKERNGNIQQYGMLHSD